MTLGEFQELLLTVDPCITKYRGNGSENYTVWSPLGYSRVLADDREEDRVHRVYVERFTRLDNDPILAALEAALDAAHVPYEYEADYEADTKYLHHTYTCYIGG